MCLKEFSQNDVIISVFHLKNDVYFLSDCDGNVYDFLILMLICKDNYGAKHFDDFFQVSFPVDYTPRKFVIHHESAHLIITETEHNAYTEDTKKQRRIQMAEVFKKMLYFAGNLTV